MKRIFLHCIIAGFAVLSLVFVSGCVTTSTYKLERTDQEAGGNQGYLMGTPPPAEKKSPSGKRTMVKVRIELPPYQSWERYEWKDKKVTGNRGYVVGGPAEQK